MNRWNEICFIIKTHSKENSKEAFFQNEVINIFEKLGWSRYKKEIEREKNIPIGANNNLRVDILISLEEKRLFVVELKKANIPGSAKTSRQLISYMLQLKMKFGLFIGENLQLFYDDPSDDKNPIKLIEIEFIENNKEGLKLIEVLKREQFDINNLIQYCNERLAVIDFKQTKNELIKFLTSSKGEDYILDLISKDLKEKNNTTIIDEIVNEISIHVKSNVLVPKENISKPEIKHSANNISTKTLSNDEEILEEIEKVKRKIPIWLSKARQTNINSQIFITYMNLLEGNEYIDKHKLKLACNGIENFESNLSQMSNLSPKNHAKIFDITTNEIKLWEPVEAFLKEYFKNNYKRFE